VHVLVVMMVAGAIGAALAADTAPKSEESIGRTYLPGHQQHEQKQPQGPTGPLDTTIGGAPAESPQGQTPPGMQAAPEGSSKTIVDDKQAR
jgi:hypothetical protein